ncbi:hypothetical protein K435DRAFT_333509 [Dendrothele bispora CBS 962.96]|uniref:Uncharacterized protein n=1 Tax=Dendrothele bispora (strain CBS 962.96) TaxID=1314807 RepID=A0A4S8MVV3_DENBC|nr:hypothetical protein K435DRAFT_333509 [Dendrothele bispora CBS 962.96]
MRTSLDGRSTSRATTTLRRSPSLPRSPTPPPTLPPLHLEDSTPSVPFLDSTVRPSSSVSENTYLPRRTADVPPRLPSPVQHSASLSEPFYPLETDSEPFHSAHISLDVSPQSPSSSVESGSDAIDLQDNTETNAVAEPSFTERLNAALDTGDIASFRERVSSAFDAFRNNNNRAYDDLGESSSSTATVRPRSSASTSSGSRSGSRPTAVLSVIIPNSSILSSSTPASPAVPTPVISGLSQLSDNSASNDNTMNAAMPPFRRPVAQAQESRGLAYRGFFDAAFPRSASDSDSPQFGVESVLGSGAVSHTLSSPSRLSPIQFLDPVWDLDGDRLTANTAGGSNSTNVSASRSTVERVPNWRQLPRPSSAQPDHQRRSLPAGGLRRRSSFSRDFARWFEDSSSDTDPASRTGAGLTNYDDTSAEEDDRPVIPVIPGLFEFYPSELRTSNSRTNAANVLTRNAGHSARTSEDRDQDDLILQSRARRLISQGLLDPRERDSVRRSLTERRRESESEAERNRRERAQRIPERSELRRPIPDWQFSWNDAFERVRRERERREREYDVETDFGGWGNMDVDHDDNPRDDTDSGQELSESERIYQRSRRMGPRAPGSFLFDSGDSDRRLSSRPFSE